MSAQHIDGLRVLSTQPSDRFKNRQIRFTRSVLFETLSSANPNAPIRRNGSGERVDEGSFAYAGFAGNEYDLTFSSKHLFKPATHPRECFVASNNSWSKVCGIA